MILFQGKLYPSESQNELLPLMEEKINETRSTKCLHVETVLNAVDQMKKKIQNGELNDLLQKVSVFDEAMMDKLLVMMDRETLSYRLKIELGEKPFDLWITEPPLGQKTLKVQRVPLGTVMHIAAGNQDGLSAYSVLEGLLCGNINILKLPSADQSLSISILHHLVQIEPELADYIYVFDTPSTDVNAIMQMAQMSDGAVVWGSEAAVQAIRQAAPSGIKLIEWGHRLSFAYISHWENKQDELRNLAKHLVMTKQLLCSSAQVIYVNTDSMHELEQFSHLFVKLLAEEMEEMHLSIHEQAQLTLQKQTRRLEKMMKHSHEEMIEHQNAAVFVKEDNELELSALYGQPIIKRLNEKELLAVLRKKKGLLQTAGLLCDSDEFEHLSDLLVRSGVNRIMKVSDMSDVFAAEAHDGEYSLQRMTRIVNIESR